MSTTRRIDSAAQEGEGESHQTPPSAWSRRALLSAASGGLALATSGLLPAWLVEEAEAANHPARRLQQRKAQRRNKRHHRHHSKRRQRRDHGHQGADQPLGIQFDIALNGGQGQIIAAVFTVKNDGVYDQVDGKYMNPPGDTARFSTSSSAARIDFYDIIIPYPFVFLVENSPQGLPVLTMGHNGTFSEQGWTGGTVVFQKGLSVGELSPPMKFDGFSFRVTRLSDTKDHTVFAITAAPPIS